MAPDKVVAEVVRDAAPCFRSNSLIAKVRFVADVVKLPTVPISVSCSLIAEITSLAAVFNV